jgi:hypothetical protein
MHNLWGTAMTCRFQGHQHRSLAGGSVARVVWPCPSPHGRALWNPPGVDLCEEQASEAGRATLIAGHRRLVAFDGYRPNAARVHDYLLGGKDNFSADRKEAERILAFAPEMELTCVANRRFMQRAVRYLAGEGITQFLDLGTGLPNRPNVHEVAQNPTDDVRVVYVDHDPVVAIHGHALLTRQGTTMIEADLRDPAAILDHERLRRVLDLERPVAVIVNSVLHHVPDEDDPAGIIAGYMERLAPGSHLVLSHFTGAFGKEIRCEIVGSWRGYGEILDMFSGLRLLEPGLVHTSLWRPEGIYRPSTSAVRAYGGVACKS